MEGGGHAISITVGSGIGNDPVGEIVDAAVKERAREVLPLVPPDVTIAGKIKVRLCADQEPCRLDRLVRAEQEVDARENIERIRKKIGRNTAQELSAVIVAIEHRNDRRRQPVVSRAEQLRLCGGIVAAAT